MSMGSVPKPPHPILLESPGGISGKLDTVLMARTQPLWSPEALSHSTCSPFVPCCAGCPSPAPSPFCLLPR